MVHRRPTDSLGRCDQLFEFLCMTAIAGAQRNSSNVKHASQEGAREPPQATDVAGLDASRDHLRFCKELSGDVLGPLA